MAQNSDLSARADEKTNQELYVKANQALCVLFGTKTKEKTGIFQQEPLPAGFKSRPQFVRSIMDAPSNSEFFNSLPQPHANTLAIVLTARGNPLYPPELVVEFTSRRTEEGDDDYDDTASRIERLKLLAEIAALTRDPATGKSKIALKLPFSGRLDFRGAAIGVFKALAEQEELFVKFGLDKVEPSGGFHEFSSDPDEVVGELVPRTLSPMQRFYLRAHQWDEQREAARDEREQRQTRYAGREGRATRRPSSPPARSEDAAGALPQVTPPPAPAPQPPETSEPAPPPALKAPRKKEKGAKTTSSAEVPPAPPEVPSLVVPPAAAPAPVSAPPAPPAAVPASAAPAVDEGQELVLSAIRTVADESKDKAKSLQAKALLATFARGEKTFGYVVDYATRLNLL